MNCGRCKKVAYCCVACQRQDWEAHKSTCKLVVEMDAAPCDVCNKPENRTVCLCFESGFLFCAACNEEYFEQGNDNNMNHLNTPCCPGCRNKLYWPSSPYQSIKKLQKLLKENKRDPRRAQWLVCLGDVYQTSRIHNAAKKAQEAYLRAGDLGMGGSFYGAAVIYADQQDWDRAWQYIQKAADRMCAEAFYALGIAAGCGYLVSPNGLEENVRRPPDFKKAFGLFRQGAALGHAECCSRLAISFLNGKGTAINLEKSNKWAMRGAEKGSAEAMRMCGQYYLEGIGFDLSKEQAKYWFEKSLQVEEHAEARSILESIEL